MCYAYDTRGREVKREYLDVAGGPTPYNPTGAAGEIREYDSRGNLKTLVFLILMSRNTSQNIRL